MEEWLNNIVDIGANCHLLWHLYKSTMYWRVELNITGSHRSRIEIYDATNSINEHQNRILQEYQNHGLTNKKSSIDIIFFEGLCDNGELLGENYLFKVHYYEEQYKTINGNFLSYIKTYNLSTKLLVNHIYGRMAKLIVPRPVFFYQAEEIPLSYYW